MIKKLPAYKYDEISIGDGLISKHVTIEALEALRVAPNASNDSIVTFLGISLSPILLLLSS